MLDEALSKWAQQSVDRDFLPGVPNSVAKSLALRLRARILVGEFKEGQRLPAERFLSEEFDVSRTTLRRALEILENIGLIARRPGSGTFINHRMQVRAGAGDNGAEHSSSPHPEPSTADHTIDGLLFNIVDITAMTSPLELIVVRSILEPEIARLAVINMSSKDIARLGAIVERMDAITTDASAFSRCDEDFYMCLAEGTRNPLVTALYKMVTIVRRGSSLIETREKSLSPNRIREYKKKHQSLYLAIRSRDIESAVEFIKLQMTEIQRDLMRDF
jgi:DNA-binding FadR family transcriptional regulator